MSEPVNGSCLCGAVKYSAEAKSRTFSACHCEMCRKWSAGPYIEVDLLKDSLVIEDRAQLGVYKSSDWAERLFCKVCGSSLFYHLLPKDLYSVALDTLDDSSDFQFDMQGFIEHRHGAYSFAEETKMVTGADQIAAFNAEVSAQ